MVNEVLLELRIRLEHGLHEPHKLAKELEAVRLGGVPFLREADDDVWDV